MILGDLCIHEIQTLRDSVPQEEDSDLIPIPDHLLEDYKHSGKIHFDSLC